MALNLAVETLSEHIGCSVSGYDVSALSSADDVEDVLQLLHRHHLVVFRDQQLDAEQLLAFTRALGEIDGTHVNAEHTLPGYPDIFVISNKKVDGKELGVKKVGNHWHTDWAYKTFPASYTMLYGLEVPETPHHTRFASQLRVYNELSEDEKANLRDRTASYLYEKTHARKSWLKPITSEQKAMTPVATHPMLRVHPGTQKEGLYVNRADCIGVSGMSPEDGVAFVNALVERIVDPAHVYAHEWKPLDLVIWDNRVLLHAATSYDMENDRRLVYRTTTKGERPIPSGAAVPDEAAA